MTVRFLLVFSTSFYFHTKPINFTLVYPQADPITNIFTDFPDFFIAESGATSKTHCLKLIKNLYGLKDAGFNWYNWLKNGLELRGFTRSQIDPCLFCRGGLLLMVYVNDCILLAKNKSDINKFLFYLEHRTNIDTGKPDSSLTKFDFTDKGTIQRFLCIEITKKPPGFHFNQGHLINWILEVVLLKQLNVKPVTNPVVKPVLICNHNGAKKKRTWHYRSVIDILNYLAASTWPDITMAVHQSASFCADLKLCHKKAVHRIVNYLWVTKRFGIYCNIDCDKGVECFCDTDFYRTWRIDAIEDPNNVLSCSGYVIYFLGCPIFWKSKLYSSISLSTTEAEYVALSKAMRDVILLINL